MSGRIRSQSPEFPTSRDVLRFLIEETLRPEEGWCHIDDADSPLWAEVAWDKRGPLINLPFPHRGEPREVLREKGADVPGDWEIVAFRRKGFLCDGYVTFQARPWDTDLVIAFVDRFFECMSPKGVGYRVEGSLESP